MTHPDPSFRPGTILLERFEVRATEFGGHGEVVICMDLATSRPIALKSFIAAGWTQPSQIRQIRREADAWIELGLDAQHVLPLEAVIAIQGRQFLLLPYCSQGDLARRLRNGAMSPQAVMTYATQLILGLWELGVAGLVHRDLKPSNILIDDSGRVRITDLGIARGLAPEARGKAVRFAAPFTTWAGTPAYMAPEQLAGSPATVQTDLWSLGVILFEMMHGHHPFTGHGRRWADLAARIREHWPERMYRPVRGFPEGAPRILGRLLEKDTNQRYAALDSLIADWDRLVRFIPNGQADLFADPAAVLVPDRQTCSFWDRVARHHRSSRSREAQVAPSPERIIRDAQVLCQLERYDDALKILASFLGSPWEESSMYARLLRNDLHSQGEDLVSHVRVGLLLRLQAWFGRLSVGGANGELRKEAQVECLAVIGSQVDDVALLRAVEAIAFSLADHRMAESAGLRRARLEVEARAPEHQIREGAHS